MLEAAVERLSVGLASRSSRRSFLGRLGSAAVALAGGRFVAEALAPERAEAFHICGHIYTTRSCPHPYAPYTRIDRFGYPVHPWQGYPIDDAGEVYTSPSQTRRRICQEWVPERFPFTGKPAFGGGWSRCCRGRVRRIKDCCSYSDTRINGDAAVTGYCHSRRKVFCIAYQELDIRC
jgi:hypothetical protein